MRLTELAKKLGLAYDGTDIELSGINTLKYAGGSELAFLDNPKYLKELKETKAAAVLLKPEFAGELPSGVIALCTPEPYLMLAHATAFFAKPAYEMGEPEFVSPEASIMPNAYIGKGARTEAGATVMSGAYIGDYAKIGAGTLIYPNVTVYRDCVIGERCIIHAGTVIGSDGFGFAHTKAGAHLKIHQNGIVVIEDDVEIGANCAIDRAVFGATVIKKGTKIDNLVQIGHNCVVGEHNIIVAQSGIAGSSSTGRNVVLGGQSATAGHLHIGDFATVAARGGVTKSIDGGKTYSGFPLMEHKRWLKLQAKISKLADKD